MADSYKYKTFTVKVSKNGEKPTFFQIQNELSKRIKELGSKGWRLVSITPINSGAHDLQHDSRHDSEFHTYPGYQEGSAAGAGWGFGWGAGWGYGYTSHLLITMEKQG